MHVHKYVLYSGYMYLSSLDGVLYGPVHSEVAVVKFEQAVEEARAEGGVVECGGKVSWHHTHVQHVARSCGMC